MKNLRDLLDEEECNKLQSEGNKCSFLGVAVAEMDREDLLIFIGMIAGEVGRLHDRVVRITAVEKGAA